MCYIFPQIEELWLDEDIKLGIRSGKHELRLVDEAAGNSLEEHSPPHFDALLSVRDDFRRDVFLRYDDLQRFVVRQGGEVACLKLEAMQLPLTM